MKKGTSMIDITGIPGNPGCYLFSDANGTIIYIGKAKNLKKRVSSYFQKRDHDQKTQTLVEHIVAVNYIVTSNEVEALILENSLIKTHQPRYNIDLKDAKQYAYIELTDEEFPCIRIARKPGSHGTFFGPFVSAAERDYVFSVVKKVFRLRTCKNQKRRACLRYHIQTCTGPCIGNVSPVDYGDQIRKATMVLRGKSGELVAQLKEEMANFSNTRNYELALKVRDEISAIERLGGRQDVARPTDAEEDIVNYLIEEGRVYLMVFPVHAGTLANKKEFVFDYQEEFLEEFLVQYYSMTEPPPELILPEQVSGPMEEFLSTKRGRKVTVTVPVRGAKRRLLDLVRVNIETVFFGDEIRIHELKDHLGLESLPRVIECFDISHTAGTSVVGSMVQFRDGRPDKRNYRRFRIKTVEGVDDFSAIGEVVRRRYARLVEENGELPDLIMVDGGIGQLHAAVKETKGLGISVPVIALAKRDEQVYMQGHAHPLPIDRKERASLFLQEIRNEAHRFAIAYHRLLRKKKSIKG
ncbi:MAG TPA: excinuclease ABC subunit UvrC [Methanoregulaceae archaeon]|nr:excinuclease ABC subunit UvrC [Methanoregulaceae archaeon]